MSQTIVTPTTTYSILRQLGEGGMGEVLLVESPRQPEPVALKFLQAQWTADNRIDGFKREFALLSELHHPHLCRVYDFEYANSHRQYFFTTEFVQGQELYRAMRNAPLEECEDVIMQLLSALDFLHSIGLVHFDVKGENVLVRRAADGQWDSKLVDFGVTSPMDKELTEIAGTLHYIAPELLLPDPKADGRCDLYSFGVMCYHLFAGHFPYHFESFEDVWRWHRQNPHIDLEPLRQRGVPDHLCQMIERLLKPRPSERFSSAAVVLNFLALHSGKTHHDQPILQRAQLAEGPFVGRSGLMTTIKNALQGAVRRKTNTQENIPRAFTIEGHDGMGKTRFLQELKYTAQLSDYSVRLIDAQTQGQSWDGFCVALGVTADTADALQSAVFKTAQERPLCIEVDNLHMAIPSVQQFIYGLMGALYAAAISHTAPPVIIVATTIHNNALVGSMTVEMQPLSMAEIESYLQQLLGAPDDLADFLKSVWEFSGGVPLLMVEAARSYHQGNALPTSIEELYAEQLQALSPQALEILQLLAFAVLPMPESVIQDIVGSSITADLNIMIQARLMQYDSQTGYYSLITGALAAVIRNGLSDDLRQKFSDPLITWVNASPNTSVLVAADYAPHAKNKDMGCRILEQAAEIAERSGKALQAIPYLEQLAQLRRTQGMIGETIAAERRCATLLLYQGRYDDCEQKIAHIVTHTGTAQVDELKLLGLIQRVRRKPEDAGKYYDQALAMISPDPTDPTYLFLKNERGQAYLETGDVARAIPILMQSHREAKALPFEKQRKVTNNNLGAALARSGQFPEATAFYQEKLRIFQNDKRLQGSIYSQLAAIQVRTGLIDDAIQSFESAWRLSTETGDMHSGKLILENIISLLQKKSAYSAALTYAKKNLELKSLGATDQDMGRSLMTLATLYLNLGLPDLAARHLIQAMRIVRRCRDYQLLGWIHINFGYLYKDLGRLMESVNAFEETIFIAEEHHDDDLIRWGRYGAADVFVDHGELEEAKQLFAQLEPMMKDVQDPEFRTRVDILRQRMITMKTPVPEEATAKALMALSAECETQGWLELNWEVEYLLGTLYQKRDEFDQAKQHLHKAKTIILKLADMLSEEYRDGFLKHRVRARVFHELAAAEHNEVYVTQVTSVDAAISRATAVIPTADKTIVGAITPSLHFDPQKHLFEYEREIIETTLKYYHHNLTETAEALGLSEDSLRWKLEQLDIALPAEESVQVV